MSPLLVVCRHFWPVCNEASYRLAHLVRFLRDNHFSSEIVTARWHSKWPATSTFNDVNLTRILPAPTSPWNESFFYRNLWNWIERQSDSFTKIYIDSLHLLTHAKLSSILRQKSFLIRFDAYSKTDIDLLHKPSSTLASLIRSDASWFIVSNAYEHRTLIGAGVNSQKIIRVAPINVWSDPRTTLSKQQSRVALQAISHDFVVPIRMPLIVVFFTGDDYEAEHSILKALTRHLDLQTAFRVWVFGCSDLVRRHYSYLKDFGVHHDILLHSSFDNIDLLINAADLVICQIVRLESPFIILKRSPQGRRRLGSTAQLIESKQKANLA